MKKLRVNILSNQIGSSLIAVMIGGVAVGAGALMLAKSGLERGKMYADTAQNTLIEYAMLDLKTNLASETVCREALNGGFDQIGNLSVGSDLGGGVSIEQIKDQNPGAQNRDILIVFKKDKAAGSASRRTDKVSIQTFMAPDPSDPSGVATIESCSSFQVASAVEGLESFCNSIGGEYDSAEGRCDPNLSADSDFRGEIDRLACEVVGGTLSGGTCDLISVSGNLMSKTFGPYRIRLGTGERTGASQGICSELQVGRGISSDGALDCAQISCPMPDTSTYLPRYENSQLYCECQRDRGAAPGCGEEDVNSCEDYEVDDGCGTGKTCIVRKKAEVCPEIPSCVKDGPKNYYSTEGCNYYCGQAPKCEDGEIPVIGDPKDPKDPEQCKDKYWTPSLANVCSDQKVSQTSNCGSTRTKSGTKDCSVKAKKGVWKLDTYSEDSCKENVPKCSALIGKPCDNPGSGYRQCNDNPGRPPGTPPDANFCQINQVVTCQEN